jgi:DNA polymerase-3 subunit epsilon
VIATDLPGSPGVYLFRGPSDEVLYIGTAVNLRRRVRNYFTGSETRGRMKEMVSLATRVDHVVCAHPLEAGVRELRLLVAHAPPYNRRSKFPKRAWWITLTDEPFPRFAIVRTPNRDALGPFNSRMDATEVAVTVAEYTALRTCTTRLSGADPHACPPAVVGGCPAAAATGIPIYREEYAPAPAAVRALFAGHRDLPLRAMLDSIETYSRAEHFEAAARLRDRAVAVVRALHRTQRLAAVARIAELIVALPDGAGGWEFSVIRYGRLAGAGNAARGVSPMHVVEQIAAASETVMPVGGDADAPPLRGASPEEVALVAGWLRRPGIRIVRTTDGYGEPVYGAGRWMGWVKLADAAAHAKLPEEEYAERIGGCLACARPGADYGRTASACAH